MTSPPSKSEIDRLGKRGSYRLGQLAPQGVPRPVPPVPFRMSFARPAHRGPVSAWLLAALAGAGLVCGGAMAGLWFAPFVIGVATGIAVRWGQWRLRVTLPAAVAMSAAGWGLALWLPALGGRPMGSTARVIAALAGLPGSAVVGVAATLLVAVAQAVVGLWLGRAIAPRRDPRV